MLEKEAYREKVENRRVWMPGKGIQDRTSNEPHFTSEPGEYENEDDGEEEEQPQDKETEETEAPEDTGDDVETKDDQQSQEPIDVQFDFGDIDKAPPPKIDPDEAGEAQPPRVEVRTPEWAEQLEDQLSEEELSALCDMPREYLLFPSHHRPITIEWLLGEHGSLKMDYGIVYLWEGQSTGDSQYPDRVVIRTRDDNVFIPADRKDVWFRIITEGDGPNIRFQGFRESYSLQKDPFGYTMFSIMGNIERDTEQNSTTFETGFIR